MDHDLTDTVLPIEMYSEGKIEGERIKFPMPNSELCNEMIDSNIINKNDILVYVEYPAQDLNGPYADSFKKLNQILVDSQIIFSLNVLVIRVLYTEKIYFLRTYIISLLGKNLLKVSKIQFF